MTDIKFVTMRQHFRSRNNCPSNTNCDVQDA